MEIKDITVGFFFKGLAVFQYLEYFSGSF